MGILKITIVSGFVVSDYDAWAGLYNDQKYAQSMEDAAALGINAGLDQEGGNGESYAIENLQAAIKSGKTTSTAPRSFHRKLNVLCLNNSPRPIGSARPTTRLHHR